MEVLRLNLETNNKLVNDYLINKNFSFFHYSLTKEDKLKRYEELMGRAFPRKQLATHIRSFMEKFSITKEIENSLAKLEDEKSVVVIGGQQAGLLTGPLYSIHKMLSIIIEAEQLEKLLQKPVVPIFWVAGEDHDIHEVNHAYKIEKGELIKHPYKQSLISDKQMVSKTYLDQLTIREWYEDLIASYGETRYTNALLRYLNDRLVERMSYTDFFISIANDLFKEYGLLFVDSAHPELRKIESHFFELLIENGERITDKLLDRQAILEKLGYRKLIESDAQAFQLFYEVNGERTLLQWNENKNKIVGHGVMFSKDELIQIARNTPEKLSNNVVTRPLMQEFLFPTLSFIAGPGEIAYWAELKDCFEIFNLKIPLMVPRINITYLERNIEVHISELHLNLEHVLSEGVAAEKTKTIESLKDLEFARAVREAIKKSKSNIQ